MKGMANVREFYEPAPAGRHPLKITEASTQTAKKSGAPMIRLTIEVAEGEFSGKQCFDYLITDGSFNGAGMAKTKLRALGVPVDQEGFELSDDQICSYLLGMRVFGELEVEQARDQNGTLRWNTEPTTGRKLPALNNKIVAYFSSPVGGEVQAPPQAQHAPAPPPAQAQPPPQAWPPAAPQPQAWPPPATQPPQPTWPQPPPPSYAAPAPSNGQAQPPYVTPWPPGPPPPAPPSPPYQAQAPQQAPPPAQAQQPQAQQPQAQLPPSPPPAMRASQGYAMPPWAAAPAQGIPPANVPPPPPPQAPPQK